MSDPGDAAGTGGPGPQRKWSTPLLVVGCLVMLVLACFGRVLLRYEQFAYRDAAHFYYPLYLRVQQEWEAGRTPLWESEENGGMPLLGNPTAAVLYPGKLIFAVLPYPLGTRVYVVAHALLAFAAMLALARGLGVSLTGSAIAAFSYAFGGPVLFQYCNIIYLVGAAWLPLGFLAVDRWLRLGRRRALLGLAVVLAMETLGGEPESAYVTGLCAGAYAVVLARDRARSARGTVGIDRPRRRIWPIVALSLVGAVLWVVGTLAVAAIVPAFRERTGPPTPPLPWMPWVPDVVAAAWGLAGFVLLMRWRKAKAGAPGRLVPMLAGLAGAAALSGALAAAQLLPVLEFTGQSSRAAGEGPHDIYPFSLPPLQTVGFVWPNLFGTPFQGNRAWMPNWPPHPRTPKVWVPTLYLGGLTLILALGAAGIRRGDADSWRPWTTAVAGLSLLGAFGEYTGPLYFARYFPSAAAAVGPHDQHDTAPIRFDRYLRDGDGSLYWTLATTLPGFRQFRFPSKLLTFTVMALAALAGLGWDDLMGDGQTTRRRVIWLALFLLVVSLLALGFTLGFRVSLMNRLRSNTPVNSFGPLDARGALAEAALGLGQGAVVFGASLGLAVWGRRRAGLAAALALPLLAGDLALANSKFVLTVPQSLFETTPEALIRIREAEATQPSQQPWRVHRVPIWSPTSWFENPSNDRVREFVEWERGTLQPKYGIELGVPFTVTMGVAELFDYEFFFGGFPRTADAEMVRVLGGIKRGDPIIYYPRRSFDMWTSRYFILPYVPRWTDEHRGIAAFLDQTEAVYPRSDTFDGPGGRERQRAWVKEHDYQILRNLAVYPRAWVVHTARMLKPISGLSRVERDLPMQEILFANDKIWKDPNRTAYDPRVVAWFDQADRAALAPYLPGTDKAADEGVTVTRYEPDHVELDARLETPGVVVMADVFYPGWTLTVDGRPAPVFRTNRVMRGAAVPAGRHKLVYTFRPESYRVGKLVSCAGLGALALLGVWSWKRPVSTNLAGGVSL